MRKRRPSRRGVLNVLFNRRTIRFFKPRSVSQELVRTIVEAGQRAPCQYQLYTVIRVSKEEKLSRLVELTGDEVFKRSSVTLLACIDLYRASLMFSTLTARHVFEAEQHPLETVEVILELGMFLENAIIAAESLGLGSVVLDYPLQYPREVSELFALPGRVVPIVFLCIGVPDENPPLRPRLPTELVLLEDEYVKPDVTKLREYLRAASERLGRERYLAKYANSDSTYLEYLAEKVRFDKEVKRMSSTLTEYLHANGLKI